MGTANFVGIGEDDSHNKDTAPEYSCNISYPKTFPRLHT